jgi:cell wall-associated NlpC family hydrolase
MRLVLLLPLFVAAALFAARPAAAQVQVIVGGPATAARSTASQVDGVQVLIGGPDPTPAPRSAHAARAAASGVARAGPSSIARTGATRAVASSSPISGVGAEVADYAQKFIGTPYVWGGAVPGGFDCSGFAQYVYRRFGVAIPRTADDQFAYGQPVEGDPIPGDLVFFQTYDWGASHVGIYIGNGYFVNSIGADVHVSSFASGYFSSRYLGARRFIRSD